MDDMKHLDYIDAVSRRDLLQVRAKESTYQGSWKKRGGIGAFMMLARKWDRIEGILKRRIAQYDIFHNLGDGSDGTLLAEIRDLRTYLLLVEAEVVARAERAMSNEPAKFDPRRGFRHFGPGTPEDGGHHNEYSKMENTCEQDEGA